MVEIMTDIYSVEDARAALADVQKDKARVVAIVDNLLTELANTVEALEDMQAQRDRALQPDSWPRVLCPACHVLTGHKRGCVVCGYSGYIDEPEFEEGSE